MRIDRLRLKNFRCFDDFEMEFSSEHNVHVLIAENMAGKSAIFQALKVGLGAFVGAINGAHLPISKGDHRIVGPNPFSDVTRDCEVGVEATGRAADGDSLQLKWVRKKVSLGGNTRREFPEGSLRIDEYARNLYGQVTEQRIGQLPLVSFFGTEYVHVASSDTSSFGDDFQVLIAYNGCLSGKSIETFLMGWYARMEERIRESNASSIARDLFGDIPTVIFEAFDSVLGQLLPDIVEIQWVTTGNRKKEMAFRFQDGSIRLFEQLSDGYQYLCLMAAELTMRSIVLNKHLGANAPGEISGVVLIDEFGIHLHPDLQTAALERLANAFPSVQFIISTHSPMLVNGLKKEQVHILEVDSETGRRTVRHPSRDIVGMGAEGILREVFGLESTFDEETLNAAKRYANLVSKSVSDRLSPSEVQEFNQLQASLSQFGFDPSLNDPMYAKFLEMLSSRARNKFRSHTEVTEAEMTAAVDALLAEMGAPNR